MPPPPRHPSFPSTRIFRHRSQPARRTQAPEKHPQISAPPPLQNGKTNNPTRSINTFPVLPPLSPNQHNPRRAWPFTSPPARPPAFLAAEGFPSYRGGGGGGGGASPSCPSSSGGGGGGGFPGGSGGIAPPPLGGPPAPPLPGTWGPMLEMGPVLWAVLGVLICFCRAAWRAAVAVAMFPSHMTRVTSSLRFLRAFDSFKSCCSSSWSLFFERGAGRKEEAQDAGHLERDGGPGCA